MLTSHNLKNGKVTANIYVNPLGLRSENAKLYVFNSDRIDTRNILSEYDGNLSLKPFNDFGNFSGKSGLVINDKTKFRIYSVPKDFILPKSYGITEKDKASFTDVTSTFFITTESNGSVSKGYIDFHDRLSNGEIFVIEIETDSDPDKDIVITSDLVVKNNNSISIASYSYSEEIVDDWSEGDGINITFLSVKKSDKNHNPLKGSIFNLKNTDGKYNKVIQDDENNIKNTLFFSDLKAGDYILSEIESPKGYVKTDKISNIHVIEEDGKLKIFAEDNLLQDNELEVINEEETVSIESYKKWENIPKGVKAPDVYFQLMANGIKDGSPRKLNPGENKIIWDNLSEFKDGKNITYDVVEVKEDGSPWKYEGFKGEKQKDEGKESDSWTFTNSYASTSISVKKEWKGGPKETPKVYFMLLKNGIPDELPDSQKNIQEYIGDSLTWKDLPLTDENGEKIHYTVKEVDVNGNEWNEEGWEKGEMTGSGTEEDPFVFENINTEKVEIHLMKIWKGGPAEDHKCPKMELKRSSSENPDAEIVSSAPEITNVSETEFKYVWKDLPKYDEKGNVYIYSVSEKNVTDGKYEGKSKILYGVSGPTGDGSSENPFVITNSYTPGKISVNARKEWAGGEGEERLTVKFRVTADGEKLYEKEIIYPEITAVWNNLNETKEDGKKIIYDVEEVDVPENYEKEPNKTGTGTADDPFVITNRFKPVTITAQKKWTNIPGEMEVNPVFFQLMAGDEPVDSRKEVTEENQLVEWNGLPEYSEGKRIEYKVIEVDKDGNPWKQDGFISYEPIEISPDNWEVVNEYHSRDITAVKKWVGGPEESKDKETVYFELLQNGNPVVFKDGQENPSMYIKETPVIWKNVPLTDADGKEIHYSLKEVNEDGTPWTSPNWKTSNISGSGFSEYPFVIVNQNTEKTEIHAKKKWMGGPVKDYKAPDFILKRSAGEITEEEVKTVPEIIPSEKNPGEFHFIWSELDKYDNDGNEYIYSVEEGGVTDGKYTSDISGIEYQSVKNPSGTGSSENPLIITNTAKIVKIKVTKVWEGIPENMQEPDVFSSLWMGKTKLVHPKNLKE